MTMSMDVIKRKIEKIKNLKDLKIDYFSSGALTHSVIATDISMKNLIRIN